MASNDNTRTVYSTATDGKCPKCGWPILTLKTTKRRGTEKVCPQKECGYSEPYTPEEDENGIGKAAAS